MENTLENKAKFFAQYWGQEIKWDITLPISKNQRFDDISLKVREDECIVLKPLSSITVVDKEYISKIENDPYTESHEVRGGFLVRTFLKYYDCTHVLKNSLQEIIMIDYLRSKGYALPYMGLSVETLQEYGWIKLQ